jgi:hypothetical protein
MRLTLERNYNLRNSLDYWNVALNLFVDGVSLLFSEPWLLDLDNAAVDETRA